MDGLLAFVRKVTALKRGTVLGDVVSMWLQIHIQFTRVLVNDEIKYS